MYTGYRIPLCQRAGGQGTQHHPHCRQRGRLPNPSILSFNNSVTIPNDCNIHQGATALRTLMKVGRSVYEEVVKSKKN